MKIVSIVILALVATGGQTKFGARASAVVIDVSVTERQIPVAGLTAEDFIVTDNGIPQAIHDLTADTLPIDVHVTTDVSGSLRIADRRAIAQAVTDVRTSLTSQDRFSVTEFATHVAERVPLGAATAPYVLGEGTDTAVFDALLLALVRPDLAARRQFSIFMTDGLDSSSYFDTETVLQTARFSRGPVTFVLAPDRAARPHGGVLRAVARQTGGDVLIAKDRTAVASALTSALHGFRASYVLRYIPAGVSPSGWHEIRVQTKSRRYAIRARQGYWSQDR